MADLEQHRIAAGFPSTNRPAEGWASSPAFDYEHSSRHASEIGYNYAAQQLIYGELISLGEVVASVRRLRDLL